MLAIALLVAPAMGAHACPGACETEETNSDCCAKHRVSRVEPAQTPSADHADTGCHHCGAPCCRSMVAIDRAPALLDGAMAAWVQPVSQASPDYIAGHLIFHPPKA